MSAGSKLAEIESTESAIREFSAKLDRLRREIAEDAPVDRDDEERVALVASKLEALREKLAGRRREMQKKRTRRRSLLHETRERIAALRARIEERKPVPGAGS